MTVVTNTSPLNYLLLIGETRLLPVLFQRLHLPAAVRDELRDPAAANAVREWAGNPPDWAQVHPVAPAALGAAVELHPGETEAILPARDLKADLLLMDELDGRAAARAAGLTVIGTLGLLDRAAAQGLVSFPEAWQKLQATGFYATPRLVAEFLHCDELRRRAAQP
jgi:predicted nucleic acid-binding protein